MLVHDALLLFHTAYIPSPSLRAGLPIGAHI